MPSKPLEQLCDIAEEVHKAIQRDFDDIDPLIGVSQNMRTNGIPADVMTVDCLRTRKRIIIILHDQQPDIIRYQFTLMDEDPSGGFEELLFAEFKNETFYHWISQYFLQAENFQ